MASEAVATTNDQASYAVGVSAVSRGRPQPRRNTDFCWHPHSDAEYLVDVTGDAPGGRLMLWDMTVRELTYGGRRLVFREPIPVEGEFSDGVWLYTYEALGISGYGTTLSEALEAFRMDFAACYDTIAQEDDRNLTGDAQHLKAALLQLVERAEDIP